MLLIKLTADDLRLIERTKSDQEKIGIFSLVQDRIQQAQTLKSFGKTVREDPDRYGWQQALKKAREVLGDAVTIPPYPDNGWYARINGVLRTHGFSDTLMVELAEFAKAYLLSGKRKTVSFDFLVCQHKRVLDGEFGGPNGVQPTKGKAPDLSRYQLPEE